MITSDINNTNTDFTNKVVGESEPSKKLLTERIVDTLSSFANISSLLRICGAIALLAAMSLFLLKGWGDQSDFERFITMIGQTGLLGVAGLAMVKGLKEVKGARLFFGLALVSISTNFTTLSALVYSLLSFDGATGNYESYALWTATDGLQTALGVLLSFVILTPLAWFGFSILARSSAKKLTLAYMGLNALLLVPVRDVSIIVALVAGACFLLARGGFSWSKGKSFDSKTIPSWKTLEGKFAHSILVLPLVIMVVRSFLHYEVSDFAWLALSASAYVLLIKLNAVFESRYEGILLLLASGAAFAASIALGWLYLDMGVLEDYTFLVGAIAFGAAMIYIHILSKGVMATISICFAIIVSLFTVIAFHFLSASVDSFIQAFIMALAALITGLVINNTLLKVSGITTLVILPLAHLDVLVELFNASGWLGYAIAGVVTIILASVIERYGAIISLKLTQKKVVES